MRNADGTTTLKVTGRTGRPSGSGGSQTKAPLNIGIGGGGGPRIVKDRRQVVDRTSAGKVQS